MAIELVKEDVRKPLLNEVAVVGLYDRFSNYPSRGLTPEKLASLLQQADTGDVYQQMELFEEMLEKDPKMFSLFQARRLAVLGKNYNIIPASDKQEHIDVAKDIEIMIEKIRGWNRVLANVLDCVPKGFSVQEIFWRSNGSNYTIEKLKWKHQKKFRFGKVSGIDTDPEEIRLLLDPKRAGELGEILVGSDLERASTDGISLESNPALRRRFAVAICQARSGHPARTSIMRTLTYLYLFKNYDIKWWIQFAEKLLGFVIGKYDANYADQKKLLIDAVQGIATDASAVISNTSSIEFIEMVQKASSHQVYSDLKSWCNDEMSMAILGHTGTSQSTPGKLGSEEAAREVKQELIEADATTLDETITEEIIVPYVDFNFGPQDQYPYYKTDVSESPNLLEELKLDQGLQLMGFEIGKKYTKEKYGRPLVDPSDPDDEVLVPLQTNLPPLFPAESVSVLGKRKKKLLSHR